MQNFMNKKESYVDESLKGILRAYPHYLLCANGNVRAIYSANVLDENKVSIITGGGYGHLPLFLGYVGKGLCTGCAVGDIFSPPSFETIWDLIQRLRTKAGILFLFGNYFNDSISFMNAAEMATLEGIQNETVKICDDISSGEERKERRGIAGCFFAYKIAGACSMEGRDLITVKKIAERAVIHTSTYGAAISSCYFPASTQPIFEFLGNEIELGAGIHGERGKTRHSEVSSKELVDIILPALIKDQKLTSGSEVAVLVNGLGGAVREDLFIVYNDVADYLTEKGIIIKRSFVGEYATSMRTAGLSISVLKLDRELEYYLNAPSSSPFFSIM